MANDPGMDMTYIANLIQGIMDNQTTIDPISQSFYNKLLDNFSTIVGILKDSSKVNKKELGEIVKYVKNTLSADYGVKFTKQFNDLIAQLKSTLESKIGEGKQVDADKLVKALSNAVSSAMAQSIKAEERGDKNALLRGTSNKNAKELVDEIVKKMGLEGALDSTMKKLVAFLGGQNKENQKKNRGLIDDLIDGLGKSKWVGGILQDTFKLIGLMGASWLSKFGQFGRVLGGAFYIAMTAFGPVFAELLVKGIGRLFTGVLLPALRGAILGLGRLLVTWSAAKGGPLGMFAPGKWGAMSGASKAAAVGRLAGGLAVAAGGTAGAIWAGGQAVDSWKEGRKGNAIAFGTGAAALGAGAIAALIAGATAPITLTLLGIGAAISGIAFFWKKFTKRNQDKDEKDKEEKSFWQNFVDWLKSLKWFGGGSDNNNNNNKPGPMSELPGGGGVNRPGGSARSYDLKHSKDIGGFKVAPDGSILNFHELTQAQGTKAIQAYQQQDPESFNRVFELVDPKYVQQGSFATDKGIKKNGKFWALSYKGAGQDIEAARKELTSVLGKKGENLVMSGGVASKGGPHHIPKLLGNFFKSHYNQYGEALDLVGTGWNLDEYYAAWQKLRTFYGKKGFVVNYENPDGHFAKSREDMKPGGHFDIKKTRDTRSAGAVENLKVKAQKQNIVSQKLIEDTKYGGGMNKFLEFAELSQSEFDKLDVGQQRDLMDQYLKKRGIRRQTNEKGIDEYYTYKRVPGLSGYFKPEGKIEVDWGDPSGNSTFNNMKFRLQSINQVGTDKH